MIKLYTSYLYARSTLERAFLEIGPFAHISEVEMKFAFDDVENGSAKPFTYRYPPLSSLRHDPGSNGEEFALECEWTCSTACSTEPLCFEAGKGFSAEGMARLLHHRHGILCHVCMNPTAFFTAPYQTWGFSKPLWIGRNSHGREFPSICNGCLPLVHLAINLPDVGMFFRTVTKELKKADSPLMRRLQSAPQLRFEPRRKHAA